MLQEQLDDIERGIDDIQKSHGEQFTVKQLMKTRKSIQAKLDRLNDTKRKDSVIDFEELGVDRLFIDESHFYKNLYLYTKMRNVGGIAQTEAQKSSDLFMKCRYLDEITGNRGTIFATGTPVSNSMVELYSVQRYLQYDTLMQNGLQHFDSWASTFGETVTALELAPEGTNFDAYLYQLVESKQKFISQIMTSKSPVRSAEDVDEVALSFAEVKMLATGDERFKEKMDLDIQVSKLRVLKQSYLSEHYDLEDRILQQFPKLIKEYEERITGYEADTALAEQHKPQGEDKFCPMTLQGVTYTEKADAGQMLLAICKEHPLSQPTEIGSYRGFQLEVYYDTINSHYCFREKGRGQCEKEMCRYFSV